MVDLFTLGLAVLLFLGGLVGYILKRLSVFEIKERRKRKYEEKDWYSDVWRTANGIQRAWDYSGSRPEEEDRKRTADQMDELTEDLKKYKRHENATDEMVKVMNEIIHRWDDSQDLILSTHSSQPYYMRGGFISDDAQELKELAEWEQKGRVRKFIYSLPERGRDNIEGVRRWWYQRKDKPLPYEIHKAISPSLSSRQLSEFLSGDVFLRVNREYGTDAVYYDSDEDKYNFFGIDLDGDGEIVVIDKYPGGSLHESQLLDRLEAAESVDTISYEDIVPNGQTVDEFEHGTGDVGEEEVESESEKN